MPKIKIRVLHMIAMHSTTWIPYTAFQANVNILFVNKDIKGPNIWFLLLFFLFSLLGFNLIATQ